MNSDDIKGVALVHSEAFPRQNLSLEWISTNYLAYPRIQYYVAESEDNIMGFISWTQKSGFRPEVVLELEQIAVSPRHQSNGIGRKLISDSLPLMENHLKSRNAILKHIMVTTRSDNDAQKLYKSVLGVEVDCTIKDLFSADEVIMIRRNYQTAQPYG